MIRTAINLLINVRYLCGLALYSFDLCDGVKSSIYLGFREGVTPEHWRDLFIKQDINGMLACLHRFEVLPGDSFIIYGGVPHAIGQGCFLMEVQEPTDYTMRVEKITPGCLIISDELIHQGVGEEKMLKCFNYECYSYEEARKMWKVAPKMIESTSAYNLKSIFNESHTDCFALKELYLNGEMTLQGNGDFFIGVICSGKGTITCGSIVYSFKQGDEIFFSAAIDSVKFNSIVASKILLCYPPL